MARLCSNRAPAAGQGAGISEQQRETLQEILVRFGLVPNTGLGFGPKGGRLPGLSGPPSFGGTAGQPGGAEGFNAAQSQAPRFQQPRAPGATIPGLPPLPPGSYGFDSQLGPSQQQESPLSTAADELIARLTSGSNASASKAVAAAARNAEARRLSAISRPRARSAPTPSPVSLPPPRPAQLQPPAFNGAPLGIGTPGFDPSAAAFGLGGMPGAGSNGPGAAGTGIGALPVVPTANQGGFGANGAPGGGAERVAPPEQPPPQQPLPQTTAPTWQDIANALAFPTPPERAWERAASGSSASASSSTSGSAAGAATASAAAATATTKRVFQRPGPPASSAPAPPPGPIEPTISSLAQAVFDSLGPAHPERVYQAALEVEFHLKVRAPGFDSFPLVIFKLISISCCQRCRARLFIGLPTFSRLVRLRSQFILPLFSGHWVQVVFQHVRRRRRGLRAHRRPLCPDARGVPFGPHRVRGRYPRGGRASARGHARGVIPAYREGRCGELQQGDRAGGDPLAPERSASDHRSVLVQGQEAAMCCGVSVFSHSPAGQFICVWSSRAEPRW